MSLHEVSLHVLQHLPPSSAHDERRKQRLLTLPAYPYSLLESDAFARDTRNLMEACIQATLTRGPPDVGLSSDFRMIVQCVTEMGRKNHDSFEEMCVELELTVANVHMSVNRVCAGMFEDNVINWGRIMALMAFGGHLALYCQKNRLTQIVDSLSPWIAGFIATRLKEWILEQGGWANLAQLYHPQREQKLPQKQHSSNWLPLVVSGITLGVHLYSVLNRYT